jgi:hypothetical protein
VTELGLTGRGSLKEFAPNQAWCEIAALAWTQMLALTGEARRWKPSRNSHP